MAVSIIRSVSYRRALGIARTLTGADQERAMTKTFKVGDHVSWNSEAGRVRGKIIKVHKRPVNYKGHIHRASAVEPQYEIKSDKTDHVALHKAGVLRRLG
jgi:Hypervirulence associated proteins TUDOR domain